MYCKPVRDLECLDFLVWAQRNSVAPWQISAKTKTILQKNWLQHVAWPVASNRSALQIDSHRKRVYFAQTARATSYCRRLHGRVCFRIFEFSGTFRRNGTSNFTPLKTSQSV